MASFAALAAYALVGELLLELLLLVLQDQLILQVDLQLIANSSLLDFKRNFRIRSLGFLQLLEVSFELKLAIVTLHYKRLAVLGLRVFGRQSLVFQRELRSFVVLVGGVLDALQ